MPARVSVYVYSSYCMTEFLMAYYHNIVQKGQKRLIILMMLDSPNEQLLCANDDPDREILRHYLRQHTYIDYNSDDWFDKLLYVLPVRGLLQSQVQEGQDGDEQLYTDTDVSLLS